MQTQDRTFEDMLDDDSTTAQPESEAEYEAATNFDFRTESKRATPLVAPREESKVWSYGGLQTKGGRPVSEVQGGRGQITQPQYNWIVDMLHDKNLFASSTFFDQVNAMDEGEFDHYMTDMIERLRRIPGKRASEIIDALKVLPRKQQQHTSTRDNDRLKVEYEDTNTDRGIRRTGVIKGGKHDVLAGRYALDTSSDQVFTNNVTFFKIWVGDRGGWNVQMYKSDELIKLNRRTEVAVVKRIAEDPKAALARYGHHKSRCGVCGRKLTSDISRALGIGPICASRWSY